MEAPVFTSIVLARLLLKTGGYGFIVLSFSIFGLLFQRPILIAAVLFLSIIAAASCSAQVDIKILIAYSSVNHICVMLVGIMVGSDQSLLGRLFLIISHGVISSCLFFLARLRYRQTSTRSSFFSLILDKSNGAIFF